MDSLRKQPISYYFLLALIFGVPLIPFKTYIGSIPISIEIVLIPLFVASVMWDWKKKNISWNEVVLKPWLIVFGLYFVVMTVSLVQAHNIKSGLLEMIRFGSYAVMFLLILKTKMTKEQYKWIGISVIVSTAFVALYGAIQYIFKIDLNLAGLYAMKEAKGRVTSTFSNPNYYGGYLNFMMPFLLIGAVLYMKKKGYQLAVYGIFMLFVINLILTYNRSSWLIMIGGIALVVFLLNKDFLKKSLKPHLLIAFVLLCGIVYNLPDFQLRMKSAVIAANEMLPASMQFKMKQEEKEKKAGSDNEIIDEETPSTSFEKETTTRAVVSRKALWKTGYQMFEDQPLLGVGQGNYLSRYMEYVEKYPELDLGLDHPYSVHNSYLKVMAETGILGILTFLAMYAYLAFVLIRAFFRQTGLKKWMVAALFIGSATFAAQNMTNNLIFIPQLNVIFWLIAALVLSFVGAGQVAEKRK